jgi:hypothetical protein
MSEPAPEQVKPGCVLFIVQASEEMNRGRLGTVRLHIDQTIDLLMKRFPPSSPQGSRMKVGVLGYALTAEHRLLLMPLLQNAERTGDLIPLSELAGGTNRQVKLDVLEAFGRVRAAEGLTHAYLILHHWLALHPGARPPIVLHWGDGQKCTASHRRASRSLRMLGCPAGATGLAHIVLDGETKRFVGEPDMKLKRTHRRLWYESSPVGLHRPARALAINNDPVRLVRALLRQSRPVSVNTLDRVSVSIRALNVSKEGNAPEEIEDAFATDPERGVAAVSDGASEGIFVRAWAQLLASSYVKARPEPSDPAALAEWVRRCRKQWFQDISYPKLRWSQQNKVDQAGGAATFLSWQLGRAPDGGLAWRAWAVGDSCLFWVRGNRLRASFPMTHSRQFVNTPWLLSTRGDAPEPAPLFAAGRCRPGDSFILATDALSQYFLRTVERRKEPNWDKLETMDEDIWLRRVQRLRDHHKIVNDDCTMVVVRVNER